MKVHEVYDKILKLDALNTRYRKNGKSEYSKSFNVGLTKESKAKGLKEIFGVSLSDDRWNSLFKAAVSGDGYEWRRIDTCHSSSLLALLFFCGVSQKNPIIIEDVKYTQCFFEVKNKVFYDAPSTDKASNVDVALYSPEENKLLLLESKFTEYIAHGKVFVSNNKYSKFFCTLVKSFPSIKIDGNKAGKNGFEILMAQGRNSKYLAGIKQMVSHIIGIATGATPDNLDEYLRIWNNNPSIEFRTILFDVDSKEFNNYVSLYNGVVDAINDGKVLESALSSDKYRRNFKIGRAISYQEVMEANKGYVLPANFKGFYGLK